MRARQLEPEDRQIVVKAAVPELGIEGRVVIYLSEDEKYSPLAAAVGSKPFVDAFADNSFV